MSVYLGTTRVTFDLEPEVSTADRERVLRALRDKLRTHFGNRITVRTDDEDSIFVALFDDNLERVKDRLENLQETLENAGQARILDSTQQISNWFEGAFIELAESKAERNNNDYDSQDLGGGKSFTGKTIRYADEDEEIPPSKISLGRKGLRLPTRK